MTNLDPQTHKKNTSEISYTYDGNEYEVMPLTSEFATLAIDEAFDWNEVIYNAAVRRSLGNKALYLVVFRSKLKKDVDTTPLLEHDRRAHAAAAESPSLIYYFGGFPNQQGEALSFCLWENAEDARSVSRDSRHVDATKMVSFYERYSIERYNVSLEDGIASVTPIDGSPRVSV